MSRYYSSSCDFVCDLFREYGLYNCYALINGGTLIVEYGGTDEEDVWPVIDELERQGYHDIRSYSDHLEVRIQ